MEKIKSNLFYLLLVLIFIYGCDPADNKLKIINNYEDNVYYCVVLEGDTYFENLNLLKEKWKRQDTIDIFCGYGDTLSFTTIGNWDNVFSTPEDSLILFITKYQYMMDYFNGKIKQDQTSETLIVKYKELLENNWVITVSESDIYPAAIDLQHMQTE